MKFGNAIAESSKSMHAKMTIIIMLILGGFFIYLELTTPTLLGRENMQGLVVNIKQPENKNAKATIPLVEIEMEDKTVIKRNFLRQPHPALGDTIPIIIESYDNGERWYLINYEAWQEQLYY